MSSLEVQQYLFDVQGYLVVEDVLSEGEVGVLNELIDRQGLPSPGASPRFGAAPEGAGFLGWGQAFCDLLDHERVMEVLRFRLGDCFRLDRIYGMYMDPGMGAGGLHSDYGASSFTSEAVPGEYFAFKRNQIYDGFVVVAWSLSDAGPEHGGFCCIPGSHKGNYKLPQEIAQARDQGAGVVIPSVPAGSVILFTESLTHATAAWRGAHQRRCLLYKYCVSHMAWTSKRVTPPDNAELTDRQQILFREPADPLRFFPSLFEKK